MAGWRCAGCGGTWGSGPYGDGSQKGLSTQQSPSAHQQCQRPLSTAFQPLGSSWAVRQSLLSTKHSLLLSWRRLCSLLAAFCSLHIWGALPGMPGCAPGLHPANRGWDGCKVTGSPLSPAPEEVVQDPFPTAPNSPDPGYAASSTGGVRLSLGTAGWFEFGFGKELIPAWSCLRGYFQHRGRVCFLLVACACLSP